MGRPIFLRAALGDLGEIREYIIRESASIPVAREFTGRLRQRCHELASLPGTLGRARDDLGPGLRGVTWRGYIILFRYLGDRVQNVRILHGQRNLRDVIKEG